MGGILVMVTGALLVNIIYPRRQSVYFSVGYYLANGTTIYYVFQVDDEQKPMSYTQTFQLLPDGQGSYFVFNDIFRLIYSAA